MGNVGGEETTWRGNVTDSGIKNPISAWILLLRCSWLTCSVCALVAMVTILYMKNQNTVIQVILRYCKGVIKKRKNQISSEVWWGKQHNLSLAGQLGSEEASAGSEGVN